MQDRILILDFGSQYTQLIARRVREAGVYSEIYVGDIGIEAIESFQPSGLILSGGPESAFTDDAIKPSQEIYSLGLPILGICYGMQVMSEQLGGKVSPSSHREFGHADIKIESNSRLLEGIEHSAEQTVWMSHGDRVESLPQGFQTTCTSANSPSAAMANEDDSFYGLQFHPEVTHTSCGQRIIKNFVHNICGCGNDWNPGNIIEKDIKEVQEAAVSYTHLTLPTNREV